MTAFTLRHIYCDDCGSEPDYCDHDLHNVRTWAKRDGWRTSLPGGRDLCPLCVAARTTKELDQ